MYHTYINYYFFFSNMALTWDCLASDSWAPSGTCEICFCEYKGDSIWKVGDRVSSLLISFTLFSHSITIPYTLRKLYLLVSFYTSIWTGSKLTNSMSCISSFKFDFRSLSLGLILTIIFLSIIYFVELFMAEGQFQYQLLSHG